MPKYNSFFPLLNKYVFPTKNKNFQSFSELITEATAMNYINNHMNALRHVILAHSSTQTPHHLPPIQPRASGLFCFLVGHSDRCYYEDEFQSLFLVSLQHCLSDQTKCVQLTPVSHWGTQLSAVFMRGYPIMLGTAPHYC